MFPAYTYPTANQKGQNSPGTEATGQSRTSKARMLKGKGHRKRWPFFVGAADGREVFMGRINRGHGPLLQKIAPNAYTAIDPSTSQCRTCESMVMAQGTHSKPVSPFSS